MPTKNGSGAPVAGRRKFLKTAGVTGAAAVATIAMPQVSRAQTVTWKYQSTWPTKDIFHEFAVDYANVVNNLSGGRLKLDVLAAGAVVPAFQMADAVHSGVLDAGHGVCAYWYGKHKAYSLFGTPPSFGWDAQSFLAWFYNGGGEALYKELVNNILKLNLVGYLYFPMPTQPLGWFKKEMKTGDDFKGMKYRTVGLSADVFKEMGASVTILAGGEIVPAMDRGLLDSAEFNNPSSDILLGFPDVAKYYMLGSHHQQMEAFEVIFNKQKVEALPKEVQQIIRYAAHTSSSEQICKALDRYSKDLEEIKKRGVNVVKTPQPLLDAQVDGWVKVIAEQSKEPFFAKVIEHQKAWNKRVFAYTNTNNLDAVALSASHKKLVG
ncbi:MAG: TRAP transporter substrate-binding protein [Xanthobacteraceae bacterium]|nr:TRAP transporter substrate-binding protein [Xanthobacteraceae bacterium]